MKLLLIQSDLVSLSLTIALPRALDRASARGVWVYKLHLLLMKLLLIQSDLVSHSLTIALPRALDRAYVQVTLIIEETTLYKLHLLLLLYYVKYRNLVKLSLT